MVTKTINKKKIGVGVLISGPRSIRRQQRNRNNRRLIYTHAKSHVQLISHSIKSGLYA